MSNKLEKAFGIIADHFKGLELSENPQADSYTAEKGSVQNIIRGSEIACKSALNLQHEIGARLKGRVRQFSGSEVEDLAIQKDTFAVEKLQEQVAVTENFLEQAKEFYKARFGMAYTPSVRKPNPEDVKKTFAVTQAEAVLQKLAS
jgi:regulatory protein YycI of two-component signal transduction system YycFG